MLKRIEGRRREHIKQRNLDSKRLMQRNRNVQAVLESKQAVESNRIFAEIRKNLYQVGGVLQAVLVTCDTRMANVTTTPRRLALRPRVIS